MQHLLEPTAFRSLADWLDQRGVPEYRAGQVRQWLFSTRSESFDDMTNLPKVLRSQLAADFQIWTTAIDRHHRAEDGTEKLLLRLADGY
ncbi:MAG: 23S rRNA (adenine(2503)-C(2))-methyltransferase RlmN, partial [Pirellulales bacterium]|nr:23S rRNA (adenine(2503)-C(2))-methyltransferase RlmN [Pirellulales bacterium]